MSVTEQSPEQSPEESPEHSPADGHDEQPPPEGRRGAVRRVAIGQLFRAFPGRTAAFGALAVVNGALPAVFALLVGHLVGALGDTGRLTAALAAIGGVLIAQELVSGARELLATDLYRRYDQYLLGRVLAAATDLPGLDLFEDPALAAQRDRAARAARYGPGELVSGLSAQWTQRASGLASAVLLAWYLPWQAVLLTVLWVAAGAQSRTNRYRLDPFWSDPLRRAAYFKRVGLLPEWAKEQRIFGLAAWTVDRFGREWAAVMAELWRTRRVGAGRLAAIVGALLAAHGLVLGLLAHDAAQGGTNAARLAIVVQAVLGMAALAGQDGDIWIENGAVPIPDVLTFERMVAERAAKQPAPSAAELPDGLPGRQVRFEGVRFRYPNRERPVFDGLDLTIEAGRSLAIVGLNGAGKTTLVKLLTGLDRPDEGRVTADGVDLAAVAPEQWRRRVAVLFQDFVRYGLPARDTIRYGAIEADVSDAELAEVAGRAGAESVLARLPRGLDTTLSRRFAGGVDLSGGQWQRLGLARAMLAVRHGARVLVLDEPTAHLDARAEADLYDRFLDLTRDLTTVLISHRFSTVRRADRIVVLEGGRVVEDGSHEALVAAGGRYAALFTAQASRFLDDPEGTVSVPAPAPSSESEPGAPLPAAAAAAHDTTEADRG